MLTSYATAVQDVTLLGNNLVPDGISYDEIRLKQSVSPVQCDWCLYKRGNLDREKHAQRANTT